MQARLRGLHVVFPEKVFELPLGTTQIGRAEDCAVYVDNEFVSRYHCLLTHDEQGLRVRDLGSKNGTFVNGCRLGSREVVLYNGDLLMLGDLAFQLEIQSGPKERAGEEDRQFLTDTASPAGLHPTGIFDGDTIDSRNSMVDSTQIPPPPEATASPPAAQTATPVTPPAKES